MKKKRIVLWAICLSMVLCACGSSENSDTGTNATSEDLSINEVSSTGEELKSEPKTEKKTEVTHKKRLAEWAKAYTTANDTWSVQVSLKENENGEVIGDVKFKFYIETFPNLSLNDPDVKKAFLDSMDDLMFGLKTDLLADNYTIKKVTGTASQYNKTIVIP